MIAPVDKKVGQPNPGEPGSREDIGTTVQAYLGHLRAGNYAVATIQNVQRVLHRFFSHAQITTPAALRTIRESDIESFLTDLLQRVSKRTAACGRTNLRGFWQWAQVRGLVAELDFSEMEFAQGSKNPPRAVPTDKEVRAMLASLEPTDYRERAMIEIMYGSGLRRAEVVGLNIDDLDLSGQRVRVVDAKSGRIRVVPLSSASVLALHVYLTHRHEYIEAIIGHNQYHAQIATQALFVSTGGIRISTRIVDTAVRDARKAAGLEKPVTTHGLRHACATEMLKGGADLRLIQEMLGHQRLDTTMIYTKVGIDDLKNLVNKFHPLGCGASQIGSHL